MRERALVETLVDRVDQLRRQASRLSALAPAVQMSLRLDEALRRLNERSAAPLLRVVMLGGTGVGKSELFNALTERPDASPVSDAQRSFTHRPYVAVSNRQRPLLEVADDLDPQFVSAELGRVALIDAPDVDGALTEHWNATRRLIEMADVVLYVASPDRRANFDVHEQVRRWADRKRWLFVMNKIDQADNDASAVRDDFDRRLQSLGFAPDDQVRFVVSALQAEKFDFSRLRATLFDARLADQVERLRIDAFLGYVQHAADDELIDPLRATADRLAQAESSLEERVRAAYVERLSDPLAQNALRVVVRQQSWRYLSEQIGWLMAIPVWIRCRLSLIWTAYRAARLAARGASGVGLLGVAATSLLAAVRGMIPLGRVLTALGTSNRTLLASIAGDARRVLEDNRLAELAPPDDEALPSSFEPPAEPEKSNDTSATATSLMRATYNLVRRALAPGADDPLVEPLEREIDRRAQRAAIETAHWATRFFANILPTAALGHIVYRLGVSWLTADYLPGSFYGMAIGVMAISFLPGYWLIQVRLAARTVDVAPTELAASLERPAAIAPLVKARRRLSELVGAAMQLRAAAAEIRRGLDDELPVARPTEK